MPKEFKLQDPGEGIHEAEILEVQASNGDEIQEGDIVLVIETDKASVEVPAPFTGVIENIEVDVGDIVKVGEVLMTYTERDESEAEAEETEAEAAAQVTTAKETPGGEEKNADEEAATKSVQEEAPEEAEPKKKPDRAEEAEEEEPVEKPARKESPVPAAPSTRRLARELDVDLGAVEPSGPGGRVLAEDVRAFSEGDGVAKEEAEVAEPEEREEEVEAPPKEEAEPRAVARTAELPDFSQWGEVERVPLRSIRRATATQMALAWSQIPHVVHMDVADITELEAFRKDQKDRIASEGGDLTLTVLAMKAAVAALKEYPRFNSSLDFENEQIILKQYYDIGIAVDTERGLLVPVIRDVDRKSIAELATELRKLVERTREGEVKREEMQGGTFTITNAGPLGGTNFTPIINYPEVAILGMSKAEWQPVVEGDPPDDVEITVRFRLPLCVAFDHRVLDGADSARFMSTLVEQLSDPESFLLSV